MSDWPTALSGQYGPSDSAVQIALAGSIEVFATDLGQPGRFHVQEDGSLIVGSSQQAPTDLANVDGAEGLIPEVVAAGMALIP